MKLVVAGLIMALLIHAVIIQTELNALRQYVDLHSDWIADISKTEREHDRENKYAITRDWHNAIRHSEQIAELATASRNNNEAIMRVINGLTASITRKWAPTASELGFNAYTPLLTREGK